MFDKSVMTQIIQDYVCISPVAFQLNQIIKREKVLYGCRCTYVEYLCVSLLELDSPTSSGVEKLFKKKEVYVQTYCQRCKRDGQGYVE